MEPLALKLSGWWSYHKVTHIMFVLPYTRPDLIGACLYKACMYECSHAKSLYHVYLMAARK